MKKRLLDLFCGAGGCSMGYSYAGFDEIVGVDLSPQPNYPFTFVQANALTFDYSGFDAIHASPPCQAYTMLLNARPGYHSNHPDLLDATRKRLQESSLPYVIENVVGSPLQTTLMLCGTMFGLRMFRHRLFESNVFLFSPGHRKHTAKAAPCAKIPRGDEYYSIAGHFGDIKGSKKAMGVEWMQTQKEIANAIPPAYTEWIGKQLLLYV